MANPDQTIDRTLDRERLLDDFLNGRPGLTGDHVNALSLEALGELKDLVDRTIEFRHWRAQHPVKK